MVSQDRMKIKLIDFSTARLDKHTITYTSTAIGNSFYMAPDYYDFDEDDKNMDLEKNIRISCKVDVWSVGCIISELLSGIFPWHNVTKNESKVEASLIQKKPFPIPIEIDKNYPEYKAMLQRCLEPNSDERGTCEDVRVFLREKFGR